MYDICLNSSMSSFIWIIRVWSYVHNIHVYTLLLNPSETHISIITFEVIWIWRNNWTFRFGRYVRHVRQVNVGPEVSFLHTSPTHRSTRPTILHLWESRLMGMEYWKIGGNPRPKPKLYFQGRWPEAAGFGIWACKFYWFTIRATFHIWYVGPVWAV